MKQIFMLPTMISVICLSAFTPSKEMNTSATAVMKTRPTVTVTYPSEFTRFINLQQKKAIDKAKTTTRNVAPVFALWWWDFNGNTNQQTDPYYYSKDGDNFPDCINVTGVTYCEIRAEGNAYDDTIPELTTIASKKYRP